MSALEHCEMAFCNRVAQNIGDVLKTWIGFFICFKSEWSFGDLKLIRKNLPSVGSDDASFKCCLNIRLIE